MLKAASTAIMANALSEILAPDLTTASDATRRRISKRKNLTAHTNEKTLNSSYRQRLTSSEKFDALTGHIYILSIANGDYNAANVAMLHFNICLCLVEAAD